MFRHHEVSDDHETRSLPDLFEIRKEAIAAARTVQEWLRAIVGPDDKGQVMIAVSAM